MITTAFNRYEKKFVLDNVQVQSIMPELLQHLERDEYCKNSSYTICSIYYDTRDSSVIRHSLSNPYFKEKLRLRSYATPASSGDQVFLELKKKIGSMVNKRRVILTLAEATNFLEKGIRPDTLDYMTSQVIDEIIYFKKDRELFPATYISYDRIALYSLEDKDLRVTFDQNILVRREKLRLESGRFGSQLLEPGKVLMEIKFPCAIPLWLSALLSKHEIYGTGFSKYGLEYKLETKKEPCRLQEVV